MEKEQYEQLIKLLNELNGHIKDMSSRLDKIENYLQKIESDYKRRRSAWFDV
jgi:prefoldin subunit 5